MTGIVYILAFIVCIGVLVFVHELGHFLAAKWAGIHVHRFALGLGKPIPWLSFTRGVTEYAVCWVPLGGYVKMATREEDATSSALEGETPLAPVAEDAYYEAKPVWKRMIVILAGVTMNFLFAWAVFGGMAWVNGVTVLSNFDVFANTGARYRAIQQNFSAVANSRGQVIIELQTVTDNALINAIRVQ